MTTERERLAALLEEFENDKSLWPLGMSLRLRPALEAFVVWLTLTRGVRLASPVPPAPSAAAIEAATIIRRFLSQLQPPRGDECQTMRWLETEASRGVESHAVRYAVDGLAPRVEPPEGPWSVVSDDAGHDGNWYVSRPGVGKGVTRFSGPFTEAEALAVRDALNRLAPPEPRPKEKP